MSLHTQPYATSGATTGGSKALEPDLDATDEPRSSLKKPLTPEIVAQVLYRSVTSMTVEFEGRRQLRVVLILNLKIRPRGISRLAVGFSARRCSMGRSRN